MALTSFWARLKSRLLADKYPVEPWEGEALFDAALPESDAAGIEFLNDDETPMEFVVAVLTRCLNISRKDAVESMLRVHFKGSAKFGRMHRSVAGELSNHITAELAKTNFPLKFQMCAGQPTHVPVPLTKEDVT